MKRCGGVLLAALACVVVLQTDGARSGVRSEASNSTDVLLAFDTAGSMGPSISAAQRDAETIVSVVGGFSPSTRFAVASFRDRSYPGGEYKLVSPMTADKEKVSAAIGTLKAVVTTNPPRTPIQRRTTSCSTRATRTERSVGGPPRARSLS